MDALMLPLNWQRVKLGDIGKPCMCKRVMKHQTTRYGEIPFYKIGTFGNTADAFISKKLFLEYKTKYSFPKKGDILISASGTIGRAVIYDGKPAYFQDSNIVWIDNDETLVKNDFLFYAYSNVKWNTEHTTILRLYNDNFRNTLIPLPPLNEQNAIANILSTLDRYLCALDALILKKEGVKKALSFELLSQRKRLKGFNQAWQRVRLGDILSYEQPTKYLVATTQYLQKGFTPILTAGKTFILGYTNDIHGIYTNIPVIIFDDFTTDSKMINFPFKVKSSAIKILILRDNNQADLKYIYEKLTLLKYQVTDHKRYWIDEFSNFEILLPPLNEQNAIANILSTLDNEITSLKNKKRQFENIKKALNHDLMSAKIRVLEK
ncbi:restriction endonuclease subunit S [Helicobacter pylori]|uniref:restriction endonuclease subunit S n=1 Tax=Helicobacter pylori TaxID=210 RepID=UPI00095151EE|nr:restriction endonuclease subunit S [Helicobacter pylori]OLR51163.1 restriction endonuclease subunit S [Helicobacter pylori]OLR53770.1 restriction endonuclease subunit S [Helicobacter pylori]